MKKIISLFLSCTFVGYSFAQPGPVPKSSNKPKLVIGIVIDQMRADFIYKYWNKFGNDGFKRLVGEGFFCKNTNYNYVPTYTGPGHSTIFTGAPPSVSGIAGNNWFDRYTKKSVYCTDDANVHAVGGAEKYGQMSPKNLLVTTFGDQMKLSSNGGSKVIGIALKDRASILPAGHSANAAYWLEPETGNWMSSTYYMKSIPQWVSDFNKKELAKKYLGQPWNTLLPIEQYTESTPDDSKYEGLLEGESKPVFPHEVEKMISLNNGLAILRVTPFGNSITKDFAIETIKSENLGKGNFTDMLTVSFSSTDIVGHQYGPQSVEVEDTYLRLDKDLAELLTFVDTWLGKGNVLVFLTADHGAVETPMYLNDLGIPAGNFPETKFADTLGKFLVAHYGDSLLMAYVNQQVYLDRKKMESKKLDASEVENTVSQFAISMKGVAGTVTETAMRNSFFVDGADHFIQKGFNQKRSGDVFITYEPGWTEHEKTGTSHGSSYPYDTHVPLIWYGWNVKPGNTAQPVEITDIAATLSLLLDIQMPDGCTGKPISALVK